MRCSRTQSSGMLRRFPVLSDAKQRLGQAFTRVREGARTACVVTGSGSRRRRHGMLCRWVVLWNPIHRVALPPCRKSRPRSDVGFQGYPEVCRSCARYWPATRTLPLVLRAIAPGLTFLFVLPALLAFGFRSPYFWQGKRFRSSVLDRNSAASVMLLLRHNWHVCMLACW